MNAKISIRLKLFFSHALAVLLVSGSIGTYFYTSAADSLLTGLQERLQSSAALISQMIDANSLRDIATEADTAKTQYLKPLEQLRQLRRMNPDIAFLYVMRQQGEKVFFVIDSDESEEQAMPGQEYTAVLSSLLKGFTSVSVDKKINTDQWGSFLSGYAPLKNGQGEYLVGLDMRADKVNSKYRSLRISGICSLLASIALAFLFSRYLASRFTGPIDLAITRCTDIARGKLDEQISLRTNDELDQLLIAFNEMSTALALSEQVKQEAFTALQYSKDELEIRVRQRTEDLNEVNTRISHEIAQRIIAQNALEEAAMIDPLTRLYNRRAMMERLEHESVRCQRNHMPFTLLFIDLDHFKEVNDQLGHDAGDTILIEAGVRMKSMLRGQDSVARWGGEEFVILLPETELCSGLLVAEKIRDRIGESLFYAEGTAMKVTASFGLAEYGTDSEIKTVVTEADDAMFLAKNKGGNRIELAEGRSC
ncbi:diguanylate cyclase [Desulfobulbus rhabdoformis]|uniref:diguanylate cyclase n=1 Tax=Desulfobulbus rhabdoformis TaxID=34032 RepID=UPI00196551C2|nr:diguanylate cyclase [Desulfobulbus rhabdoformis]MBM9616008.1 diguanylate cyclase [Desulfobulbus rhabdoformis]